jgi:hypothetical protein
MFLILTIERIFVSTLLPCDVPPGSSNLLDLGVVRIDKLGFIAVAKFRCFLFQFARHRSDTFSTGVVNPPLSDDNGAMTMFAKVSGE